MFDNESTQSSHRERRIRVESNHVLREGNGLAPFRTLDRLRILVGIISLPLLVLRSSSVLRWSVFLVFWLLDGLLRALVLGSLELREKITVRNYFSVHFDPRPFSH